MSALPDPLSRLAATASRRVTLQPGAPLFRQDDPTRGLYSVEYGQIRLVRNTRDGIEVVIHSAAAGETFAEASLFSQRYHCSAFAMQESCVVETDRRTVLDTFRNDPEFAEALAARFAMQVQSYRRRIELTAIRDAGDRVFAALADGMLKSDIKTLASEIGLTHETVYRALASLTREGRVSKSARGRYEISVKGAAHADKPEVTQ